MLHQGCEAPVAKAAREGEAARSNDQGRCNGQGAREAATPKPAGEMRGGL